MTDPTIGSELTSATYMTPRQQEILKALVQEHIASTKPIGSSTVQRVGQLDVSSATIRNELSLLEEMGYVTQPHTSAGRVPTVAGYRYFVERLMEQADLPMPEQRTIQHQFHQIRLNLDQWMKLTAAVLAHATRVASLVTPPHAVHSRFKHVELISIHDTLCLMILVLQDGGIHQEMIGLSAPVEQAHLSQISNQLNALLDRRSVREIEESTDPELTELRGLPQHVVGRTLQIMGQTDRRSIHEVYRDGLINVMAEPEFEDADKMRQVMAVLEQRSVLESILARTLSANGVQIIIGGEGPYEEIYDVSLVLSPYGIRGKASGVLGVLGPTRMRYGRAISTVRYVSQLMDSLVDDVYGE
jgi:heat-inducible transcriptional repressor